MSRHHTSDVKRFMKLFRKRLERAIGLNLIACGHEEGMKRAVEQEERLFRFVEDKLLEMAEETAMAERGRNAE